MRWEDIKKLGSAHYKKSPYETEPIDLYRSGGFLQPFAVGSIIKYAYRNRNGDISTSDVDKIIHYAEMLKCLAEESKPKRRRLP